MRHALLLASVLAGCGSNGATAPSDAGVHACPGPRPCETTVGTTRWYAITKWQIGATDKTTGRLDPGAWMDFGYDLDRRTTTAEDSKLSIDSCKRVAGSKTKVLQDGNLGRDNNLGQHVVPLCPSDGEQTANQNMTAPRRAMVLELSNATDADNAHVPGVLHVGSANVAFPDGYVAGRYWVSGDLGAGSFSMRGLLTDEDVALTIEAGILMMKLDGTDGNLAGVVSADALAAAAPSFARHFGLCPTDGATVDQLRSTITGAADLVLGAPSFQDTTRTCDAISIGLGFAASEIPAPTAFPAAMADPDPCAR